MGIYASKHPPKKHLVLDLIGDGEDAQATAHIVYGKHEHFQWCGQYQEPVRPFQDGLEGMVEFIKRMKAVARALFIKMQFTKEFRQEMRELRKEKATEKPLGDTPRSCWRCGAPIVPHDMRSGLEFLSGLELCSDCFKRAEGPGLEA